MKKWITAVCVLLFLAVFLSGGKGMEKAQETAGELLDKWEITTRTENFGENILSDICEAMEAKLAEKEISLMISKA